MLIVKTVSAKSFRSVSDLQSVENLPTSGLIGLDGINQATGGSSASGKSTFIHAIATVLGVSPFPATKQHNYHTGEKFTVSVTFVDTETGSEILVSSGKDAFVSVDGKKVAQGAAETAAYVKNLVKVPADVLKALCFRAQGEGGLFSGLTPSGRQAFLNQVLDLGRYETLIQKLKSESATLAAQSLATKNTIEAAQKRLVEPIKPILAIKADITDLSNQLEKERDKLLELQNACKLLTAETEDQLGLNELDVKSNEAKRKAVMNEMFLQLNAVKDLQDKLQGAISQVNEEKSRKQEFETKLTAAKNKLQGELTGLKNFQGEFLRLNGLKNNALSRKAHLEELIAESSAVITSSLGDNCPTCEQVWDSSLPSKQRAIQKHLAKKEELEAEMSLLAAQLKELEEKIAGFNRPYEDQIAAVQAQLEQISQRAITKLQDLDIAIAAAESAVTSVKKEVAAAEGPIKDKCYQEIAKLDLQMAEITKSSEAIKLKLLNKNNELLAKDKQVALMTSELTKTMAANDLIDERNALYQSNYEAELSKYRAELEEIEKQKATLVADENKLALCEAGIQATKMFLASVVEDVVLAAEYEANVILGRLKNTSSINVTFPYVTTTRNGVENYAIDIAAQCGGSDIDFDANLSGGQKTSVHLAIDLAFWKILQARQSGTIPGFFMFDESFEGHDVPVKEACMEVLAEVARERQIFIVDHSSEFKDYYTCKVLATFDGRFTTFQVA